MTRRAPNSMVPGIDTLPPSAVRKESVDVTKLLAELDYLQTYVGDVSLGDGWWGDDIIRQAMRFISDVTRERDEAQKHRRFLLDNDLTARTMTQQEGEIERLTAYAEKLAEDGNHLASAAERLLLACNRCQAALAHVEEADTDSPQEDVAERELDDANEHYSEAFVDVRECIGAWIRRAALAKNPAPVAEQSAAIRKDGSIAESAGAGPAKFDSVFRAEAREVWTTITGNGPGLWKDYDLQSVETLEKALQRAATLSQSKASDDHITKIAALGAIDAVHHELSRALSLNERAAELLRESLATHVACSSPEEKR